MPSLYIHEPGRTFEHRIVLQWGSISRETRDAMRAWCQAEFGPRIVAENTYRWTDGIESFYFVREDDAFAFKMRWV